MLAPVRWLKLVIYLLLAYVVLSLSIPRTVVWLRLAHGPVGWVPDPPNPLIWATLTFVTLAYLAGLVADVGIGAWKVPNALSGIMVVAFGVAILGFQAEERGRMRWFGGAFDTSPTAHFVEVMQELETGLGEHYREHGVFPREEDDLGPMLTEEGGAAEPTPYVYRWLRRRPPRIEVHRGADGPALEIEEDVLAGTILYAVSRDGLSYWMTAVVGEGAPAKPRIMGGAEGRPMVISNLPRRSTM